MGVVEWLLAAGAAVNQESRTPPLIAARYGYTREVGLLLAAKAEVGLASTHRGTA